MKAVSLQIYIQGGWPHWKNFWKSIEAHGMEIVWTFIGNRMDFGYP
jgi:hypothetical protein